MDPSSNMDRLNAKEFVTTDSSEQGQSISLDEILSMVAHEQRRVVLRTLTRTDEDAVAVSALTEQVAEQLQNGDLPDDDHRQRVRTALHHIHLPKLDACGMIVYDTETNLVRDGTGKQSQQLLATLESSLASE
ncbi:DUF7344 domain-containing protein [Natronorubrum sulfidifaciens]|uniref:DUF7344 domain-containing protein n=1 Tax=Natronorubrum sulfidifaciens TaxID=388259 RepID=UPI000ACE70F9|nr:hypothetical protein [Natronorubrum sulfidifaciens]